MGEWSVVRPDGRHSCYFTSVITFREDGSLSSISTHGSWRIEGDQLHVTETWFHADTIGLPSSSVRRIEWLGRDRFVLDGEQTLVMARCSPRKGR